MAVVRHVTRRSHQRSCRVDTPNDEKDCARCIPMDPSRLLFYTFWWLSRTLLLAPVLLHSAAAPLIPILPSHPHRSNVLLIPAKEFCFANQCDGLDRTIEVSDFCTQGRPRLLDASEKSCSAGQVRLRSHIPNFGSRGTRAYSRGPSDAGVCRGPAWRMRAESMSAMTISTTRQGKGANLPRAVRDRGP